MYCYHQAEYFKTHTLISVYSQAFAFSVCGSCNYNDFVKIEPLVMSEITPLIILRLFSFHNSFHYTFMSIIPKQNKNHLLYCTQFLINSPIALA